MSNNTIEISPKAITNAKRIASILIPFAFFLVLLAILTPFTTIPAGHVGVASLFGKVDTQELNEGFHIINPLKRFKKSIAGTKSSP